MQEVGALRSDQQDTGDLKQTMTKKWGEGSNIEAEREVNTEREEGTRDRDR